MWKVDWETQDSPNRAKPQAVWQFSVHILDSAKELALRTMKQPAWGIIIVFAAQGLGLGADPPRYEDHNKLLYYLDEQDSKQPVRSKAEWDKRRQHILANMELAMDPLPRNEKAPLEIQVLEELRGVLIFRNRSRPGSSRKDEVAVHRVAAPRRSMKMRPKEGGVPLASPDRGGS